MKEYSIKSIMESAPNYYKDKSIKIELKGKKSYLTSLKGSVAECIESLKQMNVIK